MTLQLMEHVVRETRAAYANTLRANDCYIFHDGLSAWWEKGAQDYLRDVLHFDPDRQLRGLGDTNKGTRYEGKLPGDSPEICRALDAHGFADFEYAVRFNSSLSSKYPEGDPRRMTLGTPAAVATTMRKCWTVAPTSLRIMEDINAFPRVLDKIIEADGCVVPDLFLRSGRRARRSDGSENKTKLRARHRKETLAAAPLHPDNKEAHAMLAGGMSERGAALEAARAIDFDEDKDRDSEAEEEDLLSVIGAMMAEMASMPHVGLH
jgi:hypothetical protein